MHTAFTCLALLGLLVGCARFPEVDSRATRAAPDAPFPTLLPLDELAARADAPDRAEAAARQVTSRAASLRAQAAALRGTTVLDPATRARLLAALAAAED